MKRRVVITGMGVVSPIGNTVEEVKQAIMDGKCGIGPITAFDTTDYRVKLAAEVKDLNMDQYFTARELKFNDRFTQFARIAAKQAIGEAKIDELDKDRIGIILGSGIGGLSSIENATKTLESRGPTRISPYFIPMSLINLAAGEIAIDHQIHGNVQCIVTACSSATDSIGLAYQRIRDGYEDVVVAGGCEASITPVGIGGFMAMRALCESTDPNRASIPFDKERNGFVMGEGAGILVLEELESAQKRGAKILGEVVGYGNTCDANHITAPAEQGEFATKAMRKAIEDAKINPSDINYVNAHGTSTNLNDKTESKAMNHCFGEHKPYVSSTKSMTGHLLGASGAIEGIISVLALANQFVPPTINHQNIDEECNVNLVLNKGIQAELNYAMSNSFGFGGHNASVVFKKWED
ncbi:beta-ketoacyl-ACP synthase II [Anaerorhabdus furcosa]|uniref:3-oxoacyl-[acyl-carrier-protein] synthase 2 n=1 Tax=Anaerorhabdus furcosa TaxID=118967 RepID=A0A1T4KP84_9FIRM|nr:beta-ketoacyl-ACP synthase II [Anaerorhabdus furcosa]SJZ44157.1 3-oxoacyl-[acyl-carrier-protein] synthase II [Anaerorhabdus furcosa]